MFGVSGLTNMAAFSQQILGATTLVNSNNAQQTQSSSPGSLLLPADQSSMDTYVAYLREKTVPNFTTPENTGLAPKALDNTKTFKIDTKGIDAPPIPDDLLLTFNKAQWRSFYKNFCAGHSNVVCTFKEGTGNNRDDITFSIDGNIIKVDKGPGSELDNIVLTSDTHTLLPNGYEGNEPDGYSKIEIESDGTLANFIH